MGSKESHDNQMDLGNINSAPINAINNEKSIEEKDEHQQEVEEKRDDEPQETEAINEKTATPLLSPKKNQKSGTCCYLEGIEKEKEKETTNEVEGGGSSNCSISGSGSGTTIIKPLPNHKYFYEDVVFCLRKKGGRVQFGVVVETSSLYSDDESSDSDEYLQPGEMRVMWLSDEKITPYKHKIGLADRTLVPGDIVRRLSSGDNSQYGYCREIHMTADVRIRGTKYVIKDVDTSRLGLISTWHKESAVCLDSWVGSIKDIEKRAVLRSLATGCRVEITSNDFYAFKDLQSCFQREAFDAPIFYPGNLIMGKLPSVKNIKILTPNLPLYTSKKNKNSRKFIVEKVYIDCVWVHWQCKALVEDNNTQTTNTQQQPHPRVSGDRLNELKRLNLFDACMLQINDRSYLKYAEGDSLLHINDWYREQSKKFQQIYIEQNNNASDTSPLQMDVDGNVNNSSTATNHASTSTTSGNNLISVPVASNIEINKRKKKSNQSLETENNLHNKMLRVKIKIKEKSSAMFNGGGRTGSGGVAGSMDTTGANQKKTKKVIREEDENNDVLSTINNLETTKSCCASVEEEWISEDEEEEDPSGGDVDALNCTSRLPSTSSNFPKTNRKQNQFNQLCNLIKSVGVATNNSSSNDISKGDVDEQKQSTIEENSKSSEKTQLSSVPSQSKLRPSSFNYHSSLAAFGRKFRNSPFFRKKFKVFTKSSVKVDDEFVTEALLVRSKATVVWQDGFVESDVPSTELYPITHLDGHEYFPGDLVILNEVSSVDSRCRYGVVQTVDHLDRTAKVKWFVAHSSAEEPWPKCIGESEVSVYDLRDHPDFQFRPGTMVIRVGNLSGCDHTCTAGQIIDNYDEGKVKVWWVDGHISMCWPQDLFEVAQYDSSDWENDSEDSWETESENSEYGGNFSAIRKSNSIESHILSNMDKARIALIRLEEIIYYFKMKDAEVVPKLVKFYIYCHEIDCLLHTKFFNEKFFSNLLGLQFDQIIDGNVEGLISDNERDSLNATIDTSTSTGKEFDNSDMKDILDEELLRNSDCKSRAVMSKKSSQAIENKLKNIMKVEEKVKYSAPEATTMSVKPSANTFPTVLTANNLNRALSRELTSSSISALEAEYDEKHKLNIEGKDKNENSVLLDKQLICINEKTSETQEEREETTENEKVNQENELAGKEISNGRNEFDDKITENENEVKNCDTSEKKSIENEKLHENKETKGLNFALAHKIQEALGIKTMQALEKREEENSSLSLSTMVVTKSGKEKKLKEAKVLLDFAVNNIRKACDKVYFLKSTLHMYSSKATSKNSCDKQDYHDVKDDAKEENITTINEVGGEKLTCNVSLESQMNLDRKDQTHEQQQLEGNKHNDKIHLEKEENVNLLLEKNGVDDGVEDEVEGSKDSALINCKLREKLRKKDGIANDLFSVGLCFLLKNQLQKVMNMIREKYFICEKESVEDDDVDTSDEDLNTSDESTNDKKLSQKEELDSLKKFSAKVAKKIDALKKSKKEDYSQNSPEDVPFDIPNLSTEYFQILPNAPKTHKYFSNSFQPKNTASFYKAVYREQKMLKSSLPSGVWLRLYEDRLDLLTVMICGPDRTPYEDGLFLIDMQLSSDYPKSPPSCYYISYCTDRLNPNLYEDGKVCVSLLGTWSGKDTELWGPNSTLLQVIVSIQGLILVPEPYFNEAGYEKQRGLRQAHENSRMYNEMAIIKLVQSMSRLIQNPPEVLSEEIIKHFKDRGLKMYERIRSWMDYSKESVKQNSLQEDDDKGPKNDALTELSSFDMPDFPLLPVSRGFYLTLNDLLESFRQLLVNLNDNNTAHITANVINTTVAIAPKATIEETLKE